MAEKQFNILYNFDGNLNNEQFEESSRTSILSGTPSYNASPNGQALVTSSAQIKVETYDPVLWEGGQEFGMAIKIATGVTDGVILSADGYAADGTTALGRFALVITGGNLEMRRWTQVDTSILTTITGWSLDTWFLLRFATNSTNANAYAVNGATPTALGSGASSNFWADQTRRNDNFYIGASVGAVSNTSDPVANTAATGVELDWLYFSDYFNDDTTGYLSMEDDTRGTAVRTIELYSNSADSIGAAASTVTLATPADLYPTTIEAPELGTGGGGGGPVIKEFWS